MKFLIIKTSSLGDIIQSFPVIDYLKKRFPQAQIDWVVEKEYEETLKAHPGLFQVIPFYSRHWRKNLLSALTEIPRFKKRLRKKSYDAVFDLQGNTKSAFITILTKASKKVGFGWNSVAEFPSFFTANHHVDVEADLQIQQRYLRVVQSFFQDSQPFSPQEVVLKLSEKESAHLEEITVAHSPRIMIACGSRWVNKQLSLQTLQELVLKLYYQKNPYFYFVSGNPEETKVAHQLHALVPNSGQIVTGLTVPLWQALMREMDLVITVDSAALALCGTTNIPSSSYFGPSLATVYKPVGSQHTAWQGACPYGIQFKARCPRLRTCKTGACLKDGVG